MVTSRELRAVRRAADKAVSALRERNDRICEAHEAGASIRQIAAEADLSSARVHQILHGR